MVSYQLQENFLISLLRHVPLKSFFNSRLVTSIKSGTSVEGMRPPRQEWDEAPENGDAEAEFMDDMRAASGFNKKRRKVRINNHEDLDRRLS